MPRPGTIRPHPTTRDPDSAEEAETALVTRAKRDRQAFALLYDRYAGPVYRYCYARLGTKETAEDATSLVFAKALAALPTCHDASFRSWLFAIAHNVVANTARARRPVQPLEVAAEVADAAPTPEEAVLAAEERRSLRDLLAQLPPAQRDVVELRLAGLTGAEIGQLLGRSRGSVDTTQFRALARLRTLLGVAPKTKSQTEEGRDVDA